MKHNIAVKVEDKWINVGTLFPREKGGYSLSLYKDKADLLQVSKCGKYLNAICFVEKKKVDSEYVPPAVPNYDNAAPLTSDESPF